MKMITADNLQKQMGNLVRMAEKAAIESALQYFRDKPIESTYPRTVVGRFVEVKPPVIDRIDLMYGKKFNYPGQ